MRKFNLILVVLAVLATGIANAASVDQLKAFTGDFSLRAGKPAGICDRALRVVLKSENTLAVEAVDENSGEVAGEPFGFANIDGSPVKKGDTVSESKYDARALTLTSDSTITNSEAFGPGAVTVVITMTRDLSGKQLSVVKAMGKGHSKCLYERAN